MSQQHNALNITIPANGDISTKQYYGFKIDSNGQADLCDTQGEICYGILQDKPAVAGLAANLCVHGTTKAIVSEAITTYGDELTVDAAGKLEAAASADHVCGINLELSTADGDIIEVLFFGAAGYVKG